MSSYKVTALVKDLMIYEDLHSILEDFGNDFVGNCDIHKIKNPVTGRVINCYLGEFTFKSYLTKDEIRLKITDVIKDLSTASHEIDICHISGFEVVEKYKSFQRRLENRKYINSLFLKLKE